MPGEAVVAEPDPALPVAVVLVGSYGGLGIHTLLNAYRFSPPQCKGMVFLSAGIMDSRNFKGANAMPALQAHTEQQLAKYVDLAQHLGFPATSFMSLGTDVWTNKQ